MNNKIISFEEYRKSDVSILNACRRKVLSSPEHIIMPGETVCGFEFLPDGHYNKHWIEGNMKNIAAFIVSSPRHKLVTSSMDYALLNSNKDELDCCISDYYHWELHRYINAHRHEL